MIDNLCIECGEIFSQKRRNLGYRTCLDCGSPEQVFTVAPAYNKGAYQVITLKNIKDIGK